MNINNPKITWNISDRILGFSVELSVNTSQVTSHKTQWTMETRMEEFIIISRLINTNVDLIFYLEPSK